MSTQPTINLKTATDQEIIAMFAERVCGWEDIHEGSNGFVGTPRFDTGLGEDEEPLPDFLHSFDAIQPWLEKHDDVRITKGFTKAQWNVDVDTAFFEHNSLNFSAVIALLRAHGVEVVE